MNHESGQGWGVSLWLSGPVRIQDSQNRTESGLGPSRIGRARGHKHNQIVILYIIIL
jgi:hypothetical protein